MTHQHIHSGEHPYVLKSITKKMLGGIFCDLSKAFDCVSHEILLTKLYFYGIQEIAAKWFRSYLADRKQKVKVKSPENNQNFSQTGNNKTWRSPRVNSTALAFHNIHK
jgi:hypothetical protein